MKYNLSQRGNLAFFGGEKTISDGQGDIFTWPIVTAEHEEAVMKVLRSGKMSGLDVTKEFENRYAAWIGREYGLGCPNGTSALLEAMFAIGLGKGDEIICPSITFWASIIQAYLLGATPVFADIDPGNLCLDPDDFEKRIGPKTKAVMVVHYAGMPADMNRIMRIAEKHDLMVIEDCSHAHGTLYKGRPAGSFGDVSAFSLMTGKSFAIGEAGILLTDDRHIYERALLWGHYARHNEIESENLKKYAGLPCGGCKNRMHQLSSAFGLVQLKYYPDQMEEIDNAMNYFCDLLEDTPGVRSIRPAENSGSSKGGWYYPHFKYVPEELDGLSITRFADAVSAEGSVCNPGCNKPLHLHPLFTDMDVFGDNKPTRFANLPEDTDKSRYMSTLPVSEQIVKQVFEVPWFKKFRRNIIEMHADAYKKVISNHKLLLENDNKDMDVEIGAYSSFFKNS